MSLQLFLPHTAEIFSIMENKLYGYADDSTLVAVAPSSLGERVAVTQLLNPDLNMVSIWCNLWGMKLNASKTKTMTVFRSCTIHRQSTPLILDGTLIKEFDYLVILGITLDAKMTFVKHLCSFSRAAEAWYHGKVLASIS